MPEVIEKPPLGLRPRWIATGQRAEEIVAAITRYNDAKKEVPKEWREELAELNRWLEAEGYNTYAPYEPK